MGELLDNGHAAIANSEDNVPSGKVWYQSHFCINTSKKFRVVFDCWVKFQGVSVNDFLFKGLCMRNSLVGVGYFGACCIPSFIFYIFIVIFYTHSIT